MFGAGAGSVWVCSNFKILHDLSSDRRQPGWFRPIITFYSYTLVREDLVFGIILIIYDFHQHYYYFGR